MHYSTTSSLWLKCNSISLTFKRQPLSCTRTSEWRRPQDLLFTNSIFQYWETSNLWNLRSKTYTLTPFKFGFAWILFLFWMCGIVQKLCPLTKTALIFLNIKPSPYSSDYSYMSHPDPLHKTDRVFRGLDNTLGAWIVLGCCRVGYYKKSQHLTHPSIVKRTRPWILWVEW